MRRSLLTAVACVVLAAAHPSAAAVISFQSPNLILGTCDGPPVGPPASRIFRGRLRVYEEAGVHLDVLTNFAAVNQFTVDCSQSVTLGPIIDPPPYGPIGMFAQDSDRIAVTSLTGDAIRRIRLTVRDRFGAPGTCDLLFFSVGFSICDFSGDLNFADYGFPNGVTSFSMFFLSDNFDGVASIQQIEVPEPFSGALLAIGLVAAVRRIRRVRTIT